MSGNRLATEVDRSLLDGVLAVVRRLGGSAGLDEALKVIADAVQDVLGFGAAAVNVTTPEGDLRVEAVVGPDGVGELLGTRRPMTDWLEVLAASERWGELHFYGHDSDQTLLDRFPVWIPSGPLNPADDAWSPDDSLFAPLWDEQGSLVGVLSVDEPRSGRHPDIFQRTVLEMFASQAATAIRDAQHRELADAHRREVESRWRVAFEQSPAGSALISADGRIREVNDALITLLGYSRDRLTGSSFTTVTHPEDTHTDVSLFEEMLAGQRDSYSIERRYLHHDGHDVHALLHLGIIRDADGSVQSVIEQVIDITERKRAEQRLADQLTHDLLTGLLNHAGIDAELQKRLAAGERLAVLFCDLDRFKTINDSLGRQAGDEVLVAVSRRLQAAVPDSALLGRVGGDEFVVVVPAADAEQAAGIGDQLLAALRTPFPILGLRHTVSMTIGAACVLTTDEHADELLAAAEQTMRRVKRRGRGRVEVRDPQQDVAGTRYDLQLEEELRLAVQTGVGLCVHLQPIVNIADEQVVGAEALVRWQRRTGALVQPSEFLPLAEQTGLIVDLGWRILDLGVQAAAQLLLSGRTGCAQRWVAINVSGTQLGRGLPDVVRRTLETHGVPAECVHLEITESALVDASPAAIAELRAVNQMGISIALDDFGTGYSSLSLLRDLPIGVVKIDRSFTAPIAESRRTATLVRGVVTMCKSLEITTVAEGVETPEQLAIVRALGCDRAQGFLFGRPTPVRGDPLSGDPVCR